MASNSDGAALANFSRTTFTDYYVQSWDESQKYRVENEYTDADNLVVTQEGIDLTYTINAVMVCKINKTPPTARTVITDGSSVKYLVTDVQLSPMGGASPFKVSLKRSEGLTLS